MYVFHTKMKLWQLNLALYCKSQFFNLCLGTIPFLLLAVALLLFVFCSIATFVALAIPIEHYQLWSDNFFGTLLLLIFFFFFFNCFHLLYTKRDMYWINWKINITRACS